MLYSKSISVGTSIVKAKVTEEMISDLKNLKPIDFDSLIPNEIHRSNVEKIIGKCGKNNG